MEAEVSALVEHIARQPSGSDGGGRTTTLCERTAVEGGRSKGSRSEASVCVR
jgi:hypothetical protein